MQKCLGQRRRRSFSSNVIDRTYTQPTYCSIWTTEVVDKKLMIHTKAIKQNGAKVCKRGGYQPFICERMSEVKA